MGGELVATVLSLWLGSTFGTSFLPTFNEGTFTVFLMAPPGTSLEESDRLATGVERRLSAIEGVRSVVRRTGRAERDEHAEPVSSSEIEVSVEAGHRREEIRAQIDAILAAVPGITTMVGQPIEHRLSHVLSGTPAAIAEPIVTMADPAIPPIFPARYSLTVETTPEKVSIIAETRPMTARARTIAFAMVLTLKTSTTKPLKSISEPNVLTQASALSVAEPFK